MVELGLWLLLACGSEGESVPEASIADRYATEPQAVIAEVLALSDPSARDAAVVDITEAHPGQVGLLCAALPAGPSADRCERYASRPHLWTAPTTEQAREPAHAALPAGRRLLMPTTRTGAGPAELRRPLPARTPAEPDLSAVPADPGPCQSDAVICLEEAALSAASARDTTTAAARCGALTEPRARADCAFRAAEALTRTAEDYRAAVALCRLSSETEPECHGHVLLRLGNATSADLRPGELALATEAADTVHAHWASTDPDFAAFARELFWASSLVLHAQVKVESVLSARALLPADALPHLHDLLAYSVLNAEDPPAALLSITEGSARLATPLPLPPKPDSLHHGTLWQWDLPGEEALDASILPTNVGGRRPTSEDPKLDLQLALFELTARGDLGSLPDRLGALTSDELLLRWGAARALQQRVPEAAELSALLRDPEPMVAARARGQALAPSPPAPPAQDDRPRRRRE